MSTRAQVLDPPRSALLLIDLQRDFLDPGGYAARAGLDVERLRRVIGPALALREAARASGIKVIYTREGHRPDLADCPGPKWTRSRAAGAEIGSPGPLGRLLVRGEYGHDLIDEFTPIEGELVVDKPGYSAFHQTDLDQLLRVAGIDTLIVAGVTTEVCVHSTVRAAIDLGYRCLTVSDACAASQPELQAPALAMLGVEDDVFGPVTDHATLLQCLPQLRWPIGALA